MSALAHYLEDEGVPTVAISLIRPHTEKVRNPRSLWVPFELGRPMGTPNDAAFQKRVLAAALGMLEARPGPVMLEDFPEDAPDAVDLPGWRPPYELPHVAPDMSDYAALSAALLTEVAVVAPWHERFVAATRRSTVGVAGMRIEECVRYMAAFLTGAPPASPDPTMPAVQVLRFAIDDVKAFHLEAMSAAPGLPSSRQMVDWFWDRSLAARTILALRNALTASEDKRSQAIGRGSLVPAIQVQRLGLS